jgi:hypothetical protein
MTVYAVYEPPSEAKDLESRADGLVFIKDGFSWGALLVPGIWLIWRGLWLELLAFALLFVLLDWLFGGSPAGQALFGWTALGLVVLFAFEANDLRGAALERRGYRFAGSAAGPNRDSAELSFFRGWLAGQKSEAKRPAVVVSGHGTDRSPRAGDTEEVIGLFPRP